VDGALWDLTVGMRIAGCGVAGRTPEASAGAPSWCLQRLKDNISGAPVRRQAVPPTASDSYLVDSASSHMLVSKIKPCMSKYKQLYGETANGSLYKLSFI
jgi:hypothetical protein